MRHRSVDVDNKSRISLYALHDGMIYSCMTYSQVYKILDTLLLVHFLTILTQIYKVKQRRTTNNDVTFKTVYNLATDKFRVSRLSTDIYLTTTKANCS